jgi:hypothetical protein
MDAVKIRAKMPHLSRSVMKLRSEMYLLEKDTKLPILTSAMDFLARGLHQSPFRIFKYRRAGPWYPIDVTDRVLRMFGRDYYPGSTGGAFGWRCKLLFD